MPRDYKQTLGNLFEIIQKDIKRIESLAKNRDKISPDLRQVFATKLKKQFNAALKFLNEPPSKEAKPKELTGLEILEAGAKAKSKPQAKAKPQAQTQAKAKAKAPKGAKIKRRKSPDSQ